MFGFESDQHDAGCLCAGCNAGRNYQRAADAAQRGDMDEAQRRQQQADAQRQRHEQERRNTW